MEGPEACREIVWAAVGFTPRKRHTVQALQEHNNRRPENSAIPVSLPGLSAWRHGSVAPSSVLALPPGGPCAGLHRLGQVEVPTHSTPPATLHVVENQVGTQGRWQG